MAKKKQIFPKRAKDFSRRAADVEIVKNGFVDAAYMKEMAQKMHSGLEVASDGGVIIYSPVKTEESVVDFAEISLQEIMYESLTSDALVNEAIHGKTLLVRLHLMNLEKYSMVGLRGLLVQDVRLEIFQQEGSSQGGFVSNPETFSEAKVILSGYLDCTDETILALTYLFKGGYINVKPFIRLHAMEDMANTKIVCRLVVGATQKSFDCNNGLLDGAKKFWNKSMLTIMIWLRPDLHTDEAIYGPSENKHINHSSQQSTVFRETEETEGRSEQAFDPALLYEAIRPDHGMPPLDVAPAKLVAKLRPYQSRAAHWMLMREKNYILSGQNECQHACNSNVNWPFCLKIPSLDGKAFFFYNPFSGVISKTSTKGFPEIQGGILADEMGLGKTVELLACILASADRTLVSQSHEAAAKAGKALEMKLLKRKRERIACPCGEGDDDDDLDDGQTSIWVQCKVCDVLHHASCVGFGMNYQSIDFFYYQNAPRGSQSKSSKNSRGSKPKNTLEAALIVKKGRHNLNVDYICGTCARLIGSVEVEGVSNATLIVCPSSILGQWQEEISRHTEKGALKVIVYEGFQKGPGLQYDDEVTGTKYGKIVGAHELATADIVLTTYSTLQADLLHDMNEEGNQPRSMRYMKRYPVVPTPLTRMTWHRVCLDEAQMVESSTAQATEMAKRLNAEIRWCITGTPIQKSLDDLHGLLSFLGLQPFCDSFWWTKVLKEPYEKNSQAAVNFVHKYLKKFFWRSCKAHISHELGLPPQADLLTWLTFSPVESHFYRRQHERCAERALEVMDGNIMTKKSSEDRMLTPNEVAKIMHPLLSLRQACCHPQVGSAGLRSLQKLPMTMDEVLKVLVDKAKTDGEEAQRNMIGALNGLAALKILESDHTSAVSLYREALSVIEENREMFNVDPLQKLHVLYNLQEVLPMPCEHLSIQNKEGNCLKRSRDDTDDSLTTLKLRRSDSGGANRDDEVGSARNGSFCDLATPRTLRDGVLGQQCQEISTKYMSSFYAKLLASQQDFADLHKEVCVHMKALEDMHGSNWWLDALASVTKESREAKELVKKIKNSLLERDGLALSRHGHENASSLALRFHDLNGLQYILNRELDAILECRRKLLEKLFELDDMMKNPSAEDVRRAGNCSQCNSNQNASICAVCEADQVYQMYENRLFLLKSTASSVGEVVSLEDAFAAQQRLLSQKRLNTLEMAAGSCGSSQVSTTHGSRENQARDVQVVRLPSETELILKLIKASMKRKMDPDLLVSSSKHLELLETMRKEYAQARLVTASQRMVLLALDELNMARTRLCLKFPGEEECGSSNTFAVYLEEIPQRNAQLTGEKFSSLDQLRRARGQVRYLQGLAMTRQKEKSFQENDSETLPSDTSENAKRKLHSTGGIAEEICPVCQEHLGAQMMIFPCGHLLCCKCLMTIAEDYSMVPSAMERKRIACPTCRYYTPMENIAFIDNGSGVTPYALSINKLQSKESNEEASIIVDGSYGTKMEAVVRRILRVQASEPNSRFLVFSTWNDVLDVVEHTLSANKIAYIRAKGQRNLSRAIKKFKNNNEEAKVLLLLIQHGANGLNLTEAQHVILVEPLLNPSVEAQAVNRVHRIGQESATFVHRFLIKDTVEESIYKLRERQLHSPNWRASIGKRSNQEVAALTVKDIKMLFKGERDTVSGQTEARDIAGPSSIGLNLRELPPSVAAAAAAEARLQKAQNLNCSEG